MISFIALGIAGAAASFLGYVATLPKKFKYTRSGVIDASPEEIFPYISRLQLGGTWSPYEKRDPAMKKSIEGQDGAPGARLVFDGSKQVGAGSIEIVSVTPLESVVLRLQMSRPFKCDHRINYRLRPEGSGTSFTWEMEGDNNFMGKLMSTLIDCDKMLGKDMSEGISNLRSVILKRD